jgi:hypothetical protein
MTGDNLGSVINIRTKTADREGAHARLILDPAVPLLPAIGFSIVPYEDISIVGSIRRSDIDWIFDIEKSDFYFQDFFFKVEYNLFNSHRITLLGHGSEDEIDYRKFNTKSAYTVFGLTWEYLINKHLYLKTVISKYSMEQYLKNTRTYTDSLGAYARFYPEQERLFQVLNFSANNYYLKAGYEYIRHQKGCEANIALEDIANIDFLKQTSDEITLFFPVEGNSRSLFLQGGYNNSVGWINLGIRNEKYGPLNNKSNSYSADAGLFITKMTSGYIKNSLHYAHPDIYYFLGQVDPDFKDAKAKNWSIGVNHNMLKSISINGEVYYSQYENLNPDIIYSISDEFYKKFAQLHPFSEESEGRTYGGELYIKWRGNGFSGWTSYSYSVSKRKNDTLDEFYSDFDQTHLFRLLVSWKWNKWIFSSTWHMCSSLPYTPITGSSGSDGNYSADYGERNSGRFNMHTRLDAKASYYWEDGKRFYLEVWNLLINKNNTIFEYYDDDRPYGRNNPENFNDLPFFIWLGFELCI